MSIITVKLTFDTFRFQANLADAAAPIRYINDERDEETGEHTYQCTPYQTADARHRVDDAVMLMMDWLGMDYWRDPADEIGEDAAGKITIGGKPVEQYIRDLIVSVTETDE